MYTCSHYFSEAYQPSTVVDEQYADMSYDQYMTQMMPTWHGMVHP